MILWSHRVVDETMVLKQLKLKLPASETEETGPEGYVGSREERVIGLLKKLIGEDQPDLDLKPCGTAQHWTSWNLVGLASF